MSFLLDREVADDSFIEEAITETIDATIAVNEQGRVAFANSQVKPILGYGTDELVGMEIDNIASEDEELYAGLFETDYQKRDRVSLLHQDGSTVSVEYTARKTDHGGERFATMTLREGGDKKEKSRNISEGDEFVPAVFDSDAEAIFVIDLETYSIKDCNQRACDLLNYDESTLLEQTVNNLLTELNEFDAFVEDVCDDGRSQSEIEWQTRDLETVLTEVVGSIIHKGGDPYLAAFVRNVSVRYDQQVLRELLDHVPRSLFALDSDGNIVEVNKTACQDLGYSRADILDMKATDISSELGIEESWADTVEQARSVGRVKSRTAALRNDDTMLPVDREIVQVELDQEYFLVTISPVSESDGDEEEKGVDDSQRLGTLFDHTDIPVAEYNTEDDVATLTRINSAFEDVFGYEPGEILGRRAEDVLVPDGQSKEHREIVNRAVDGERVETEVTRRTKYGERDFLLRTVPFNLDNSRGGYVIYTDITHQVRTRDLLETVNEASQELLAVESVEEVAEVVTSTVEEGFGFPLAAVFEYDSEHDCLVPQASTATAAQLTDKGGADSVGVIESGDHEMRTFHEQEPEVIKDYQALENASHPDAPGGRVMLLPINGYGMLAVGRCDTSSFCSQTREMLGTLVDTAHASFMRLEREETLRRRSLAMDSAIDGMALLDESGEFIYINEAHAKMYGYDRPEELIGKGWQRLYSEEETERLQSDILPVVETEGRWRGEVVGCRKDGSSFPQELSLTALKEGGLICIARDITRWKEHERRLKELNEASHELTRSQDTDAVTERALDAACDILGFDIGCVRLIAEDHNAFERVAISDDAESLLQKWPAFDLDSTAAGRAYRQEEVVVNDRESDHLGDEIPIKRSYHFPIGEHGTLSLFERPTDSYDELTQQHALVLAASLSAALDRTQRESELRASKQELRRQRDELESLNQINTLVRNLVQGLVETTDRDAIERMVCEHLTDSELYECAWIGRVQIGDNDVVPQVGAGIDSGYLDALESMPTSELVDGIVEEAIDSRSVKTVQQLRKQSEDQDGTSDDTTTTIDESKLRTAVPLVHGDHVYGVLAFCRSGEAISSSRALSNFEMLGDAVGFAIHAARSRELLLTDKMTEIEFEVTSQESLAVHVSDTLDCYCRVQTSARIGDGQIITYLQIEGAQAHAGKRAAEEMESVDDVRIVRDEGEESLLEVTKTESATSILRDAGATMKHATASEGTGRIIAEIAPTSDLREIIQSFENECPGYEFVAKREVDKKTRTTDELRDAIEERLTEKQRGAITSAFAAGYYEWPRETTAQELAEGLGISSSTLHQHLRSAEKKLLGTLIEEP